MHEQRQSVACRYEVEVEVAPCDEFEAHVQSKQNDIVLVGVNAEQRQQTGKHLHKSKVNEKNNRKVFQLLEIGESDEHDKDKLRCSLRLSSAMICVTNAREYRERADEQRDDFKLDHIARAEKDEGETRFLLVLLLQKHVVVDEKEECWAGEEEQVKGWVDWLTNRWKGHTMKY